MTQGLRRFASSRSPLLATLLVAAVFAAPRDLHAQAFAQRTSPEGYRFSVGLSSPAARAGDLAIVELRIEGLAAARTSVAELRLDPGLKLEAESIRPGPGSLPSAPRADFRFELRVLGEGELKIESLVLLAEGKRIHLGSVVVRAAPAPDEASAAAWRWVAPDRVYCYEAFELRLEPLGAKAKSARAEGKLPSFEPPANASVEVSGPLSWTVIPFDAGALAIPEANFGPDPSDGAARAIKLKVMPLPAKLEASRAIGQFALSLGESQPRDPVAGAPLRLSLVLEGKGNLPAVLLPEPRIELDGAALPRGAWSSSRVDDAKPEGGSYDGRASLDLEIVPPRAGELSIVFPSFATLDPKAPGATARTLLLPARVLRVGAAPAATPSASRGAPVWGPSLGIAAAEWSRGERGRALALVYAALRRAQPLSVEGRDARKAAIACEALLGTDPPCLDLLPSPLFFAIAAALVAFAGLALFMVAKRGGRRVLDARGAQLLLALALVIAGFGVAAGAERRERYAVIWADSLSTVPSAKSELAVSIMKGSTARLRGKAGSYAGLVLSDGVEGWASLDSIYWY